MESRTDVRFVDRLLFGSWMKREFRKRTQVTYNASYFGVRGGTHI